MIGLILSEPRKCQSPENFFRLIETLGGQECIGTFAAISNLVFCSRNLVRSRIHVCKSLTLFTTPFFSITFRRLPKIFDLTFLANKLSRSLLNVTSTSLQRISFTLGIFLASNFVQQTSHFRQLFHVEDYMGYYLKYVKKQ